ncbi:ribonuclease P protein subunit p30 [Daktulosphaira vitifoliae]|uniref:ribonuclease P protein subunit p30 n=1 Tax=Daktulosphaira vitifoliae TaxID=58002 RepID=UPI0021AA571B|nr:ribonuclease P protein subunit p30 [Daktulosphaira vitifoliae]
MKLPRGFCDLRVEQINKDILNTYVTYGYSIIALNTNVDSLSLDVGVSNRKKRKKTENSDVTENKDQQNCVPATKKIENDTNLTILNRLTVKVSNLGQFQKIVKSPNFKQYDILAVEPLSDQISQELVSSPLVDIIVCNAKNMLISAKQYKVAVEKNIHFEICYGPMLRHVFTRQDTITLAHLLHIKGKSKNIIVSSAANLRTDIRNPYDIINLGLLFGLSKKQSKDSICDNCHLVVLRSYGKRLGKSAINIIPICKKLQ